METRTGTARTLSSTCWALGCSALLGALACQSAAEPQVQSEPARTASSASAAAASSVAPSAAATAPSGTASSGAPATPPSAAPAAPIAQVGLAKYEEPSAAPAAPAAAATGRPSTAVQAADAPTAAAGQTVQGTVVNDESFSTWLQAVSPVSAGSPATVEAVLVAKSGYHCNAEYPHKFKLGAAPAGLSYPEATVKGMQVSPERSVLRIPVVAQSPGKATVSGTLQFSVCNDERCLIEKRELSLDLEVK